MLQEAMIKVKEAEVQAEEIIKEAHKKGVELIENAKVQARQLVENAQAGAVSKAQASMAIVKEQTEAQKQDFAAKLEAELEQSKKDALKRMPQAVSAIIEKL